MSRSKVWLLGLVLGMGPVSAWAEPTLIQLGATASR